VVDVVINLRPAESNPGKVLGGLVQFNNYGLRQFGREQLLGNVRIAGFTPLSELSLTTQQSRGVGYYRADYEAPIVGTGMRWKVYGSEVRSEATNVRGLSNEMGAGLTKLLNTDRDGRWYAGTEVSRRQTKNWNLGDESANRVDNQLRLKLRAESSKGWADNFSNELTLFTGQMNLDRNTADRDSDADPAQGGHAVAGSYQKIEMNGGLSHGLDKERIYTGSIRWRAQAASKNLDTYNRFSLGGINGIRAFTALDGVGDQGAQVSFDITHQIVPDVYGSLFYDIGVVKNYRKPLSTDTDTGYYTLQGVGWQVGGKVEDVNWSLSVAHAIGKTPGSGVWNSSNTVIGDWRVNLAVTKPF
jgi:hemolysin activation/secretion protein